MGLSRLSLLLLLIVLLIPSPVSAQKRVDDFQLFLSRYRAAVNTQNKTALEGLISARFDWALDGYVSRDEAMRNIGTIVGWSKFWRSAKRAVVTKPQRCSHTLNLNNHSGYCVYARTPFPVQLV